MQDTTPRPFDTIPPDVLDRLHNAPCAHCCGEGTVEGYEVTCDPDVLEPRTIVEPCPHCKGSGYAGSPWEVAA